MTGAEPYLRNINEQIALAAWTNGDGITFEPFIEGTALGYRITECATGRVEHIVLDPSGYHEVNPDNGATADTFVYHAIPGQAEDYERFAGHSPSDITEYAKPGHLRQSLREGGGRVTRGYFAIGVYHPKTEANIGTLFRTAHLCNAAFVFTVGRRYRSQASATPKTPRRTPLFHFETVDALVDHLPHGCRLVGVELGQRAEQLPAFDHPERAAYLLGAEDHGLPAQVVERCHRLIQIPSIQPQSMNVAVAGSLVTYDRYAKGIAA